MENLETLFSVFYLSCTGDQAVHMHSGNLTVTPGQPFSANLEIHISVAAGAAAAAAAAVAYVVKIGQHGNIRGRLVRHK